MELYSNYSNNEEYSLKHYGVLGMRWGIRKARRNELSTNFKKDKLRRAQLRARKNLGQNTFKERRYSRKKIREDFWNKRKEIKNKYKNELKTANLNKYKKKYKTAFDIYRTQKLDKLMTKHALKGMDLYGTMAMKYVDQGNEFLNNLISDYALRQVTLEEMKNKPK